MGKKKKKDAKLCRELRAYEEAGVRLILDGHLSTASKIARAYTVHEEGTYMRDYIHDEEGEVREVIFDLVKYQ